MKKNTAARRLTQRGRWCQRWRRLAIYIRDSFACQYCGSDLRSVHPAEITLDHLVCRCKGGTDAETNLVTACIHCNCARGTKDWWRFAPAGAVERIKRQRRRRLNILLAKELVSARPGVPAIRVAREANC